MSELPVDEVRPEVCPKGHALWYFECDDRTSYRWAVCDGCKFVWRWEGKADGPLLPCYGFNPERLVELVQAYGAALGYFTRKGSRAVRADQAQPWRR